MTQKTLNKKKNLNQYRMSLRQIHISKLQHLKKNVYGQI